MSQQLSEQELLRRQKLIELQQLGINPYPADEFKINIWKIWMWKKRILF